MIKVEMTANPDGHDARKRIMSVIQQHPELDPLMILIRIGADETVPVMARIAAAAAAWPGIHPKLSVAQIQNIPAAPTAATLDRLRDLIRRTHSAIDVTPTPAEPDQETAAVIPLRQP
jgi:hypothetical protein